MPTITAKIQIHVSDNQAESLKITTNAYRKACNWLSKHIFETKNLNQVNLNNLYYSDLRNQFRLKSQMAQSVMKTVIARYKSAKSNGHEWSLIDFKLAEYDLVWNRDYSLTKNQFSVNTLEGRLKLNYERKAMKKYFKSTWKFGTAKLVHKYKKWFLHIPMTKEYQTLDFADVNNIVGVDLGINFLATTYDSQGKTTFYNGNIVKHKRGKFKATRKQLQTRQTPSSRKKIKQIGSRENRYVTDVNHQITKALRGTMFVLEDLTGVRSATEKVRVKNRYVSVSWAFYQFRQMLEYKAELNGQKVIVVDPKYTSQTCPKCGNIEKANRNKKLHTFKCKNCQYQSNDDRIGAMNLHRKGIKHISVVTTGV
ncbi:RNA-guided endonuclease InsQ/TnpB family protein [Bacillus cereus]|uniref:RNA-guided endonuclease InsQ/TnpB family protein n=2 Tax=Bacillus cereus group TaxID=86661 RepID=UPI000BF6FC62|nr:RNA-guided endonuclease TnpB family protein [Bacillus cereus]PEV15957.1 transposase [Bacillus cereus]PGM62766.1 transposase [Bacillus cereus]HDR8450242.1 transposase [Bacillus cereus]HDR8462161.1 transposase [Bacillus cereus]